MKLTDEKLFEQFREGSAAGFEELLDRYKGPLFTVILKRVRDRGLAEDIFQETFKRVIEHSGRFDEGRRFSPWIYRIAMNLCVDMHRKMHTRSEVNMGDSGFEPLEETGAEDQLKRNELRERIEAALKTLTDEQREVFMLREYAGMSFKDIAEATASPLNTVLGRMHTAIKKLRVELASELGE
jgi:RNA polymerase sigma-70 factor (ECF subfamily)